MATTTTTIPGTLPCPPSKENRGAMDASPLGLLAYGCGTCVCIVDVHSMQVIYSTGGDRQEALVTAVRWSPESMARDLSRSSAPRLAMGTSTGRVSVFEAGRQDGGDVWVSEPSATSGPAAASGRAKGEVVDLCWIFGRPWHLAVFHLPAFVVVHDSQTGRPLWRLEASEPLCCLRCDPFDCRRLCALGARGLLLSIVFNGFREVDVDQKSFYLTVPDMGDGTTTSSSSSSSGGGGAGGGPSSGAGSASLTSSGGGKKEDKKEERKDAVQLPLLRLLFSPRVPDVLYVMLPREILTFDLKFGLPIGSTLVPRSSAKLHALLTVLEGELLLAVHTDGKLSAWLRKESKQAFTLSRVEPLLPSLANPVGSSSQLVAAVHCPTSADSPGLSPGLLATDSELPSTHARNLDAGYASDQPGDQWPGAPRPADPAAETSDLHPPALVTASVAVATDDGRVLKWEVESAMETRIPSRVPSRASSFTDPFARAERMPSRASPPGDNAGPRPEAGRNTVEHLPASPLVTALPEPPRVPAAISPGATNLSTPGAVSFGPHEPLSLSFPSTPRGNPSTLQADGRAGSPQPPSSLRPTASGLGTPLANRGVGSGTPTGTSVSGLGSPGGTNSSRSGASGSIDVSRATTPGANKVAEGTTAAGVGTPGATSGTGAPQGGSFKGRMGAGTAGTTEREGPVVGVCLSAVLHTLPSAIATLAVPMPSALMPGVPRELVAGWGTGDGGAVSPMAVPLVALATAAGTVEVVDAGALAVVASHVVHTGPVKGVRWLGNSRIVSFSYSELKGKNGGFTNRLAVTCIRSGLTRPFRVLPKPERAPMRGMRASPSGRYLLLLFREAPAEVWAMTRTPQMLRSLALPFTVMEWSLPVTQPVAPQTPSPGPSSRRSSLSSAAGGNAVVSAYLARRTPSVVRGEGSLSSTITGRQSDGARAGGEGHVPGTAAPQTPASAARLFPEVKVEDVGESFAFALVNGSLGVFELRGRRVRDFRPKWPLGAFGSDVLVTAMGYRGPLVVMGDRVGNLRWWDVTTGLSGSFNTHQGGIRRIRFAPPSASPAGARLGVVAVLFNDHTFRLYDLDTAQAVTDRLMAQPGQASIQAVEIDWLPPRPDALQDLSMLAVAAIDGSFRLLEVRAGLPAKGQGGSRPRAPNLLGPQPATTAAPPASPVWDRLRPVPLTVPALLPAAQALGLRMLLQQGVRPYWFMAQRSESHGDSTDLAQLKAHSESSWADGPAAPVDTRAGDLRHFLLEGATRVGDVAVLEVLLKSLGPLCGAGNLLGDEAVEEYGMVAARGTAARCAFAAAQFGDPAEAAFWAHLPSALAALAEDDAPAAFHHKLTSLARVDSTSLPRTDRLLALARRRTSSGDGDTVARGSETAVGPGGEAVARSSTTTVVQGGQGMQDTSLWATTRRRSLSSSLLRQTPPLSSWMLFRPSPWRLLCPRQCTTSL